MTADSGLLFLQQDSAQQTDMSTVAAGKDVASLGSSASISVPELVPVSLAPDGVCPTDHTELCLNVRISSRTGIPLNHHLLSESQELFRMETEFFPKRINH